MYEEKLKDTEEQGNNGGFLTLAEVGTEMGVANELVEGSEEQGNNEAFLALVVLATEMETVKR